MKPARRRYELAQLLAETDASDEDRAWPEAPRWAASYKG